MNCDTAKTEDEKVRGQLTADGSQIQEGERCEK
jgi:hypothetical protein